MMISPKCILFISFYISIGEVTAAAAHTKFVVPSSSRALLVHQKRQIEQQGAILVRGGAGYYDDNEDDPYHSQYPRGRSNDDYYYDERDKGYPPSVRLNTACKRSCIAVDDDSLTLASLYIRIVGVQKLVLNP